MNQFRTIRLALGWVFIFCIVADFTYAQENTIDADFRAATIERLNSLMIDNYVFPDVAEKTAADLNQKLKAGEFDDYNTAQSFAEALTKAVQAINKDKHMRIRPTPPRESPDNSPERLIEEQLDMLERSKSNMAGFKSAERLDGNIGYLDLRGFAGVDYGAPVADLYMQLLANSDAIIIDLRKNGGGDPNMVQYLCSYFFDQKVHLNSLYWRQSDQTHDFWTLEKVNGTKMPEVPLFVLTSNYTFSGAEEFSYNMQTQKRATLVGETTGGGANPGGTFPINPQLMVFIPTGRAINPITGTNWEGVGVVPEVKTTAEEALDKAIALATEAAEKHRKKQHEQSKELLTKLHKSINKLEAEGGSDAAVIDNFKACTVAGLLTEGDINQMGYYFLHRLDRKPAAVAIFKANTALYPESANVFDSYAESLLLSGQKKEAVKYYQKAVEMATKDKLPNLDLFKENLERAKGQMGDR
jgi:C-terminal processing protease CtpA/Prc